MIKFHKTLPAQKYALPMRNIMQSINLKKIKIMLSIRILIIQIAKKEYKSNSENNNQIFTENQIAEGEYKSSIKKFLRKSPIEYFQFIAIP